MPLETDRPDPNRIADGVLTGAPEGPDDGVLECIETAFSANDLKEFLPHIDPEMDDTDGIETLLSAGETSASEQCTAGDEKTPVPSIFTPKPGDRVRSPAPLPARHTPAIFKTGQQPECSLSEAGEEIDFSGVDLRELEEWAKQPLSPIPADNSRNPPGRSGMTPDPFERRHSVIMPGGNVGNMTLNDVFKGYDELNLRNGDEHGVEVVTDGMNFHTIDRAFQAATELSDIALSTITHYQFSFKVTMSNNGKKDDPIEFDHVKNAMRKKYGNWPADCYIELMFEDEELAACSLKLGPRYKNDKHRQGDFISDSGELIAAALRYATDLEELHVSQNKLAADIQTLGQYYMAKVRRTPKPHMSDEFEMIMGRPPFDTNPLVTIMMGCKELTGVPSIMPYDEYHSATIIEHSVSSGLVKGFLVFPKQHIADRGGYVIIGGTEYSLETKGLRKYIEKQGK